MCYDGYQWVILTCGKWLFIFREFKIDRRQVWISWGHEYHTLGITLGQGILGLGCDNINLYYLLLTFVVHYEWFADI